LDRKKFQSVKQVRAAIIIQKTARGWMARSRYQAQRTYIIRVQSYIRRRIARKQMVLLRAEQRSVSHLKDTSLKLETRVTDMIETLSQQREEKSHLKVKAVELEGQVKTWIERYERLDQKAKDIESIIGLPAQRKDNYAQLRAQREQLQAEYFNSIDKIKTQDKDLNRLKQELNRQREEISSLRNRNSGTPSDNADINELKNQILALKANCDVNVLVQ
jgi:myosin heavy subunit